MDSGGMFRSAAAPGFNEAAASVMSALLVARELGKLGPTVVSGLGRKIAVGFFQGEAYGRLGSKKFFDDVASPPACTNYTSGGACLSPLYPSMAFRNLTGLDAVLAIDQVGRVTDGTFYSHETGGSRMGDILALLATGSYGVVSSTRGDVPPTPLTSFLESVGDVGDVSGVVLSGYDDVYVDPFYRTR